jgi:hypothetical protein
VFWSHLPNHGLGKEMLPITVVSATRYDKGDFYLLSALGRSLSQTYQHFPVKSKIYFNNVKSLPLCYNDAIASAVDPEEMLVFVHDDVFIVDFFLDRQTDLWFSEIRYFGTGREQAQSATTTGLGVHQ